MSALNGVPWMIRSERRRRIEPVSSGRSACYQYQRPANRERLDLHIGKACVSQPASELTSGVAARSRCQPKEQGKRVANQVGLDGVGVLLADLPYRHRAPCADGSSYANQ